MKKIVFFCGFLLICHLVYAFDKQVVLETVKDDKNIVDEISLTKENDFLNTQQTKVALKDILSAVIIVKTVHTESSFESLKNNDSYYLYKENNNILAVGTGFLIGPDGKILTNNHIIKGADKVIVFYNEEEYIATVVGYDRTTDIAVLKIKNKNKEQFPYLDIKKNVEYDIGNTIFTIGNPHNLGISVSRGTISALDRVIDGNNVNMIQTDAVINSGNSGGPMIDEYGNVIGIVSAIFSPTKNNIGIGFATPIKDVVDIIDKIISFGYIQEGWIGVDGMNLEQKDLEIFGLQRTNAILITNIIVNSPADKAGLKIGDIIISCDNNIVISIDNLNNIIKNTEIGSYIELLLLRNGKYIKEKVVIGEYIEDEIVKKELATKVKLNTINAFDMNITEINSNLISLLNLQNKDISGLYILSVKKDSYMSDYGIKEGDVILFVNQQPVSSIRSFKDAIQKIRLNKGKTCFLLIKSGEKINLIKVLI